jgi:hypothetical protein
MVGHNERFGLPVSASSATFLELRFDRLARWAVALPAFSPSLAKQPGYRPSQTVDNVQKTRYFPSNHRLPHACCRASRFRDFCRNPCFPFTLRPEYELCVAGSAVPSLTS